MSKVLKGSKVLFMYNPSSGKGRISKNIDYIVEKIIEKYGSCDVIKTLSEEHLKETVKTLCSHYDYFFFSGGDGTFNMVVSSIPDIDKLPVFGYLPGGSTNDMGYNLNISKNIKKGIYDLLNSEPKTYNIGKIGDSNFIYVATIGAFTDIPHITPQTAKKKWGTLAYFYYGIKSVFHLKTYKIIIDGVIYYTPLIAISNSREVASFKINPEKDQKDTKYYTFIVKNGFLKGIFNVCYLFAFGLERAIKRKKVHSFTAQSFSIDCEEKMWDLDGEIKSINFPTRVGYSGKSIQVFSNRD